jgi:hypothetical protein
MATTKRTGKPASKSILPTALEKNAHASRDAKRQRLADAGFKALSAIKALRAKISDDFLEMGRALQVLKSKGVADAMGYGSFEALCAEKLDLSVTRAELLITLFERLDAGLVRELGTDRASALMNLADATPEDDHVEDLLSAKLQLPSGAVLDVARATVQAINDAAATLRRARAAPGKKRLGLTVDAAEQRRFDAVVKRLKAVTGHDVTAKLIATRSEGGADAQVRMSLSALVKLVAAARKGTV